jgi:hypothetical protein
MASVDNPRAHRKQPERKEGRAMKRHAMSWAQLSVRDIFWMTLVICLVVVWLTDRYRLSRENERIIRIRDATYEKLIYQSDQLQRENSLLKSAQ